MPHITTCTSCGKCYEEVSEELANAPERECIPCWRARVRRDDEQERRKRRTDP